jgi:hypothetical protein
MTIRSRLVVLTLQVAALLAVTWLVTERPVATDAWFASVLALSLNKQLLEPYFARPVDVVANCIVALFLYGTSNGGLAAPAWRLLAGVVVVLALLAVVALVLGASRSTGSGVRVARAAKSFVRPATAFAIYSATFWISLVDYANGVTPQFWSLGLAWLIPVAIGGPDWLAVAASLRGRPAPLSIEGVISPGRLLVTAAEVPPPGSSVNLVSGNRTWLATVLARIPRPSTIWAELLVSDPTACEELLAAGSLTMKETPQPSQPLLGTVAEGSDHAALSFWPIKPLQTNAVVAVQSNGVEILYQIKSAQLKEIGLQGGKQLATIARASQIGVYDATECRLVTHPWVPAAGAAVTRPSVLAAALPPPPHHFRLGTALGTEIPIYADIELLQQGHLVILGMTRMGKSTLAIRLARAMAANSAVTVLDQTGEYKSRYGLTAFDRNTDLTAHRLTVFEPTPGSTPFPDQALEHFRLLLNTAVVEYRNGDASRRVVVVDEAHQFIPEPAMLGFGTPGRDSAIQLGMYLMQIRKYSIAGVLISQRTAVLAKSALSQCENLLVFKNVDQTGLDYLTSILGPETRDLLPSLTQGQALAYGPAITADAPVVVALDR